MEEYMIYKDVKGIEYVKGDIGGGYTLNSTEDGVWNYCFIPETVIEQLCINTEKDIRKDYKTQPEGNTQNSYKTNQNNNIADIQNLIELHEMRLKEAKEYNSSRITINYTAKEYEQLVSLLKELQMHKEKEAKKKLNYKNNPNNLFQNDEVMIAAMKLQSCFRGSKILYDADPIEFLANENCNAYFIIGNCQTKEDVDCKVLEWLSRYAYKAAPYRSKASNENLHRSMLAGINAYLGTSFDKEDIETIYIHLGNAYNHEKTLEFVHNGYNMDILSKEDELER